MMSSSMIAKAAALKPEIRLAQSVSEFEASLSDEHKATFRSYRTQSLNKPLDPSDVMRLTAEIDRRAVQQDGGGQCFGPRLTNILQAVQQYAALGDVIVGGSQNIIACGIWSSLRLTLLALVSFSSYMEKLSKLLMVAGRKAPRYEQMALLYPRSSDLQACLSEYFIVVIQLCRRLYKTSQKKTIGLYFSFHSDLDLKEHETNLQLWADCIKDEVTLLTARRITEQSTLLGVLSKKSDYESLRKRLRTRYRMLEACSTYDHQTTWKEIRKSGNSTLLAQIDQYAEWKTETTSTTLLCTGKLGFGKSVLLANMVDELNLSTQCAETAVVYFFCRHDIEDSLRARTIIGSITRQLIPTDLSQLPDEFSGVTDTQSLDDLLEFVLSIIPKTTGAFVVLDGLDECDDDEREITLRGLKRLQEAFPLRVCCSFSSDMHLKAAQEAAGILIHSSVIQLPEDNPDISSFITKELQRCTKSGRLSIGDPSLILEIERALAHGAQGMFLWVILQIASLCTAKSDEDIRRALKNLPKGLPETFARILKQARGTGDKYQRMILQFCLAARRPLTAEELREALSIAPYDIKWNEARLVNNIFAVMACCGSLITVDEEHLTVRLLHHSVKQYLIGNFDPLDKPIMTLEDSDKAMGKAIITYLNYDEFENALSKTVFKEIPAQDIPSGVAKSVLRHSLPVQQVALKLFQHRLSYQHDLKDTLIPKRERNTQKVKFDFHHYAKTFWLCHIQWLLSSCQDSKAMALFVRLLEKCRVDSHEKDSHDETLLWKAVASDNTDIVHHLLRSGHSINALGRNEWTVLHLAATLGLFDMMRTLLDHGADIEARDFNGRTAISLAAYNGHQMVLESLLERSADVEARDDDGWTPLLLAIDQGHKGVVRSLVNYGAQIEAETNDGRSALEIATDRCHGSIYRFLLGDDDSGKDTSQQQTEYDEPTWLQGDSAEQLGRIQTIPHADAIVERHWTGHDESTWLQDDPPEYPGRIQTVPHVNEVIGRSWIESNYAAIERDVRRPEFPSSLQQSKRFGQTFESTKAQLLGTTKVKSSQPLPQPPDKTALLTSKTNWKTDFGKLSGNRLSFPPSLLMFFIVPITTGFLLSVLVVCPVARLSLSGLFANTNIWYPIFAIIVPQIRAPVIFEIYSSLRIRLSLDEKCPFTDCPSRKINRGLQYPVTWIKHLGDAHSGDIVTHAPSTGSLGTSTVRGLTSSATTSGIISASIPEVTPRYSSTPSPSVGLHVHGMSSLEETLAHALDLCLPEFPAESMHDWTHLDFRPSWTDRVLFEELARVYYGNIARKGSGPFRKWIQAMTLWASFTQLSYIRPTRFRLVMDYVQRCNKAVCWQVKVNETQVIPDFLRASSSHRYLADQVRIAWKHRSVSRDSLEMQNINQNPIVNGVKQLARETQPAPSFGYEGHGLEFMMSPNMRKLWLQLIAALGFFIISGAFIGWQSGSMERGFVVLGMGVSLSQLLVAALIFVVPPPHT